MLRTLKNALKVKDIRNKILFTLAVLLVYRLGTLIAVPGVNAKALQSIGSTGLISLLDTVSGGGLAQYSIFSMGVSPYITASIIIELLSMDVIPTLTQWREEGETGRKKKDRVTRYVTVILAAVQAFSLTYAFDKSYGILRESTPLSYAYVVIIMVAGAMFAMWMGDQITNKGIGNGVSLLIFTGIVSNLPTSFITVFNTLVDRKSVV